MFFYLQIINEMKTCLDKETLRVELIEAKARFHKIIFKEPELAGSLLV